MTPYETIALIVQWACEREGIESTALHTNRKNRVIVRTRSRIVSVARIETDFSYPEIGECCGVTHAAVLRQDRHLEDDNAKGWLADYREYAAKTETTNALLAEADKDQ